LAALLPFLLLLPPPLALPILFYSSKRIIQVGTAQIGTMSDDGIATARTGPSRRPTPTDADVNLMHINDAIHQEAWSVGEEGSRVVMVSTYCGRMTDRRASERFSYLLDPKVFVSFGFASERFSYLLDPKVFVSFPAKIINVGINTYICKKIPSIKTTYSYIIGVIGMYA
jgi:hypothetical protein